MKYYQLAKEGKKADLFIFGTISSYPWREKEKDAYTIVKELQELDADEIDVHINSMGGSVPEGLAIYNVLKNHSANITTYCDGFACSAASVVFMAGDQRVMNESSLLMIHNAWTQTVGNANELRKQADDLEIINQASVNAYKRRATISEEEIKKMMNEEKWISADEAKKLGFATKIYEEEVDAANQSAMGQIKQKLLMHNEHENTGADPDELAGKVVEKILEQFTKVKKEKMNSWEKFFA